MMNNPLDAFGRAGTTGIILGIWAAALICIFGAVSQARSTADISSQAQALQALIPAGVKIKEETLNKEDYDQIATGVASRYSSVKVVSTKKSLEIQANNVESYSAWLASLFDVMASRTDVRWKVITLCAGESCSGPAFRVELEGIKRVASTS